MYRRSLMRRHQTPRCQRAPRPDWLWGICTGLSFGLSQHYSDSIYAILVNTIFWSTRLLSGRNGYNTDALLDHVHAGMLSPTYTVLSL